MCCRRDPEACGWLSPGSEASKTRCENISETLAAGARTWKHPRTTACPKSWLEPLNVEGLPFCIESMRTAGLLCVEGSAQAPIVGICLPPTMTARLTARASRRRVAADAIVGRPRLQTRQLAALVGSSNHNETVFAKYYKAIPWHVRR